MPEIWKYTLDKMITPFRIATNHTFLHVGLQNKKICVWAQVDTTQSWVKRTFRLIGTGQYLPSAFFEEWTYLGTVVIDAKELVWHVYVEDVMT